MGNNVQERKLLRKIGLVLFQDEIDALPDIFGDGDLGAFVKGLQLLALFRGDIDGGRYFLSQGATDP